jgi:hypothetical protein
VALVLQTGDFEFYLTIAALPLSLILLFAGHMAARYENRWLMGSFIVGCAAAEVYFCYKVSFLYHFSASKPTSDIVCSIAVLPNMDSTYNTYLYGCIQIFKHFLWVPILSLYDL